MSQSSKQITTYFTTRWNRPRPYHTPWEFVSQSNNHLCLPTHRTLLHTSNTRISRRISPIWPACSSCTSSPWRKYACSIFVCIHLYLYICVYVDTFVGEFGWFVHMCVCSYMFWCIGLHTVITLALIYIKCIFIYIPVMFMCAHAVEWQKVHTHGWNFKSQTTWVFRLSLFFSLTKT